MATTGPPPGLAMRAPAASSLPPNPFANAPQASPVKHNKAPSAMPAPAQGTGTPPSRARPNSCPRTYSRAALLAYSSSPLVQPPQGMAPLREWFGEWEPYHHKSVPYQYRDSPRRNVEESVTTTAEAEAVEGVSSGGLIGGALGGFGPKRGEGGARFGRRHEERERGESGLRVGALPARGFPQSGKNPFGQISASGTFRPAGSAGGALGREREPRGSREAGLDGQSELRRFPLSERSTSFGKDRNRERDAPPHLAGPGEDRSRGGIRDRFGEGDRAANGRDFGGLRDRRRGGGLEGDEDQEDGEQLESGRVRKTGGADLASDWRKPSDKDRFGSSRAGGFANGAVESRLRGERFARDRGKGAPSWMDGDAADSPAWMDEETSSPLTTPSKSGAFGAFGRRREAEADGMKPKDDLKGAVDSIQAFKAQMKERERLEREKALGTSASSGGARLDEYDFKSDNNDKASSTNDQRDVQAELADDAPKGDREASQDVDGASGGPPPGLYDAISNSHSGGTPSEAPPGLPGRSSRFARFFDGRPGMRDPQAAALAAQQKLLESRGDMMSASSSTDRLLAGEKQRDSSSTPSEAPSAPPAHNGPGGASGINIADLFKQAASKDGTDKKADGSSKGGLGANPSEADVQSMQKLMAMLQSGGGSQSGVPRSNDGRDTATPSSTHVTRPESVNRMRELLEGSTPASQAGRGSNGLAQDDERSQLVSHNTITSPQTSQAYGFPPGISSGVLQQQQQQQHHPHHQQGSELGGDQRAHHSRVVSTSSMSSQQAQQRSQSPAIQSAASPYNDHAAIHRGQQPLGFGGSNGGGVGSRPGEGPGLSPYGFPSPGPGPANVAGRPPFGLDPRMLGRPPMAGPGMGSPGPGQLPPHIAAALGMGRGPVPPPGLGGPPQPPPGGLGGPRGAPPMSGNYPNFPPFGGRPPPPGMPPQLYQQLMSLPPHLQQQLLSGQGLPGPALGHGPMPGQGGPRSPYEMPMQHPGGHPGGPMPTSPQPQQQQHEGMGSPPPPGIPPVGSQAMNGANLMALLSGAHRGVGGN